MSVLEAIYQVLKDNSEGLTAAEIANQISQQNLYAFPNEHAVDIVSQAIARHCTGANRNYACQEQYFTTKRPKGTATPKYQIAADSTIFSTALVHNFVFPQHQVDTLNLTSADAPEPRIIDVKNYSIRKLLERHYFNVPDYQRSYSWKASNIDEFLDDIFNIIHSTKTDARHFMGAITITKTTTADSFDLIDGQQRMTTIFIFLYVILGLFCSSRFAAKAAKRSSFLSSTLADVDDDGELRKSKLILGEFNRKFFNEFIIKNHSSSSDEREKIKQTYIANSEFSQNQAIFDSYNRIRLAIEERLDCCESEDKAYEYLKALQSCILDRVELVTMTVEDEADAFLIFETLNDRGLVLSSVDLIKNKLFQTFATRPKKEFEDLKAKWEEMCDNIEDKDDLKKYILHYWRAFKGYTTAQALYKTCRDHIAANDFEEAKKIVVELNEYSGYYNGFCNPGSNHPWKTKDTRDALSNMNKMRYDLTHPILLAALRKYSKNEESFKQVVQLCLNFMIRYISVLKNKPTSIEKVLSIWACDPNFSIEMLKKNFTEKASDAQFRAELLTLSLPYQSPLTHYMLCVYEADGFDRKEVWTSAGRSDNTVEHVLPQTISDKTSYGAYWITKFGSIETCTLYEERMGNYAFLTRPAQSKAKNKDFPAKKDVYAIPIRLPMTKKFAEFPGATCALPH